MTPRLKTALWVQAQVRLCDINLIPIVVTRKGDPDAGSILLKLMRREGRCMVLRENDEADTGAMHCSDGGIGSLQAIKYWVRPRYDWPVVPTRPFDHGSRAAHSTAS